MSREHKGERKSEREGKLSDPPSASRDGDDGGDGGDGGDDADPFVGGSGLSLLSSSSFSTPPFSFASSSSTSGKPPTKPLSEFKGPRGTGAHSDLGRGRRGIIRGMGRKQPKKKQSAVEKTFQVDRKVYKLRSQNDPEEMICPLGSTSDFDIMRGDLLFFCENTRVLARKNANSYPDRAVTASFNGATALDNFVYAGISSKDQVKYEGGDDEISTDRAGLTTIENLGTKDIVAMHPVIWSLPYVITGRHGKKISGIDASGVGCPVTKFRAAVYTYDDVDSAALLLRCMETIQLVVLKSLKDGVPAPMLDTLDAALAAKFSSSGHHDITMPMHIAMRWCALETVCSAWIAAFAASATPPDVGRIESASKNLLEKSVAWMDENIARARNMMRYNSGNGADNAADMKGDIISDTTYAELTADINEEVASFNMSTCAIILLKIKMYCTRKMTVYSLEQAAWVRAHTIGIAMSDAKPGYPFDILLGGGIAMS